jgi:predicted nucleic acid-binding protein
LAYLDANVLVPLVVPEPLSSQIERWFDRANRDGEDLVISDWCLTEVASALGIKCRQNRLTPRDMARALETAMSTAEDVFRVVAPRRADYRRATEFLAQPALGLRAGDALHLAVAVGAEAGPVVTLDKTMLRAARRLGIEAVDPNG